MRRVIIELVFHGDIKALVIGSYVSNYMIAEIAPTQWQNLALP